MGVIESGEEIVGGGAERPLTLWIGGSRGMGGGRCSVMWAVIFENPARTQGDGEL